MAPRDDGEGRDHLAGQELLGDLPDVVPEGLQLGRPLPDVGALAEGGDEAALAVEDPVEGEGVGFHSRLLLVAGVRDLGEVMAGAALPPLESACRPKSLQPKGPIGPSRPTSSQGS